MILKIYSYPYSLDGFSGYSNDKIHDAKVRLFHNSPYAQSGRSAHIGRMHSRRVQLKKVNSKSYTDGQKLLSVNCMLEENLLYSAGMDIDAFGKPFIGVTLPT